MVFCNFLYWLAFICISRLRMNFIGLDEFGCIEALTSGKMVKMIAYLRRSGENFPFYSVPWEDHKRVEISSIDLSWSKLLLTELSTIFRWIDNIQGLQSLFLLWRRSKPS